MVLVVSGLILTGTDIICQSSPIIGCRVSFRILFPNITFIYFFKIIDLRGGERNQFVVPSIYASLVAACVCPDQG